MADIAENDIFQKIVAEFRQQHDFEAFLNKQVHFDNRDWTYGQFLYKHCFDEVQKFTYKCKDYFDGKEIANFGEAEKNLAQKVAFIFSNNLAGPNGVLQTEKIKELDIFNGDKEKKAFYQNLFANSERSVEGNPCYWHPVSQYQTLVIENELSKIGMSSEQIRDLMVHCEKEREKAERFYKDNMPAGFVHNSKVSPAEMGGVVQTRLRSVDSSITTQKYCFIAEPQSFHSGLPMQGDKEFKSWPRFSPKVMVFQMSATEFADKTQDSYNYQIDMSQRDAIRPCIPLWGGAPSEWVSVKDLSYSPEVEKETLQDLQKQGMKFYLVPNPKDWELLRQAENLSEKEAEIFMQNLCKEGKADIFSGKDYMSKQQQELSKEIRITEPSPEHYQAFLTACRKMQNYTNSSDTPDDISKEVSKGFIFAKEEFLSLSRQEFKTKIVDEYAQRSQDGAKKPEHLRFIMVGDEIAGYINVRALPRDEFDERQGLETCKKWDYISEKGARACISDVLLPEYRGKGVIGKATKLFFDELKEKGINEVLATVLRDNSSSNSAHEKMVDNYGGKSYEVYGDPDGNGVQHYNRYIISTDSSGQQKNKENTTDAWNIAFDEKNGEFVEVNDKTGEHRTFQQEQEFKPEPEKLSKAPEMKFNANIGEFEYANPKFQELAEHRRELNRTKQDILALKERIAKQGLEEIGLEGKMGQTGNSSATNPNEAVTEIHKKVAESQIEDLKPFIKNYLEQRRSK